MRSHLSILALGLIPIIFFASRLAAEIDPPASAEVTAAMKPEEWPR